MTLLEEHQPPKLKWHDRVPAKAWVAGGIVLALLLVWGVVSAVSSGDEVLPGEEGILGEGPPVGEPAFVPDDSPFADACLGGSADLDEAVLFAQANAPITEKGAASFVATASRWRTTLPASEQQQALIDQVTVPSANVRERLLNPPDPQGWVTLVDYRDGYYYVSEFSDEHATIFHLSTGRGTKDGQPVVPATMWEVQEVHVVDGKWRLGDNGESPLSTEQIAALGNPYAGGC